MIDTSLLFILPFSKSQKKKITNRKKSLFPLRISTFHNNLPNLIHLEMKAEEKSTTYLTNMILSNQQGFNSPGFQFIIRPKLFHILLAFYINVTINRSNGNNLLLIVTEVKRKLQKKDVHTINYFKI